MCQGSDGSSVLSASLGTCNMNATNSSGTPGLTLSDSWLDSSIGPQTPAGKRVCLSAHSEADDHD